MIPLPNRRKLSDPRLLRARQACPDEGAALEPTGDLYSVDASAAPIRWFVAFRCPEHPDEVLSLWNTGLQPLIDEVLQGVDVSALPVIAPNEL